MKMSDRRRRPRLVSRFRSLHWYAHHGGGRAKRLLKHWARIASLDPGQRITFEIGRWESFRFIETPYRPP